MLRLTSFPTSTPELKTHSIMRFVSLIDVDLGLAQYNHRTGGIIAAIGPSKIGWLCGRCNQTRCKPYVSGCLCSLAGESSLLYPMTSPCSLRILIDLPPFHIWRRRYSGIYQRIHPQHFLSTDEIDSRGWSIWESKGGFHVCSVDFHEVRYTVQVVDYTQDRRRRDWIHQ